MLEAQNDNDGAVAAVRREVSRLVREAKEAGGEEAAARMIGALLATIGGVSIAALGREKTLAFWRGSSRLPSWSKAGHSHTC